jgi:hypothetical protein
MVALLTLFSILLFTPPASIELEDPAETRRSVQAESRRFVEVGAPDVAKIYRLAAPSYREGITRAYAAVDPAGEHPEWEHELWRICRREAWCGHFGRVTVHEGDGWAGAAVYADAVGDGLLDPEGCPAHRLADYTPVIQTVKARVEAGRWSESHGERILDALAELDTGEFRAADFSTRGGFGQMQARRLWMVGRCTPPTAADNPQTAALIAAKSIASCARWEGEPGSRSRRYCTCTERTRRWVGGGRWEQRTTWRNARSVDSQCGAPEAARFWFQSVLEELDEYAPLGQLALAVLVAPTVI